MHCSLFFLAWIFWKNCWLHLSRKELLKVNNYFRNFPLRYPWSSIGSLRLGLVKMMVSWPKIKWTSFLPLWSPVEASWLPGVTSLLPLEAQVVRVLPFRPCSYLLNSMVCPCSMYRKPYTLYGRPCMCPNWLWPSEPLQFFVTSSLRHL